MHRIDAGRRGPCLVCLEKREKEAAARAEQASITCPRCGKTSYHPKDIEQGYCGNCHDFTSPNVQQPILFQHWSKQSKIED